MSRKKTFEEVYEIIKNFGYELVDKEYKGNKYKITVKDENYFYSANINNIMSGNKLEKFHKYNPFTINNIKSWIKLNNKNFEIISEIFPNASDKILWKCLDNNCGEIFDLSWNCVYSQGQSCPYCSGRRSSKHNNFQDTHTELAKEWHPTKNGDLTPYDVTSNSGRKVWWLCSQNSEHEWEVAINNRIYNKTGCPYCSGRLASKNNNLLVNNPELCKEWDYNNNNNKLPEEYTPFSNYKASWVCSKCDNKWNASIGDRNNGKGCPKCNQSKGENKVQNWLINNNIFFNTQYKFENCINKYPLPFDFAVFNDKSKIELQCLIEYDGEFHYQPARYSKDKEKMLNKLKSTQINDKIKNDYCLANNIKLIRIPYWDFDNIESILNEQINNINQ